MTKPVLICVDPFDIPKELMNGSTCYYEGRLGMGIILGHGMMCSIKLPEGLMETVGTAWVRAVKVSIDQAMSWCAENCSGKYWLAVDGMTFEDDADRSLFAIRHGGTKLGICK